MGAVSFLGSGAGGTGSKEWTYKDRVTGNDDDGFLDHAPGNVRGTMVELGGGELAIAPSKLH